MQYLVFDPRFGAAGDMILSSLLALGADREAVSRAVSAVSALTTEETNRCGIPALSLKTNTGKTHRTLADIITIIDAADAPDDAKALAFLIGLKKPRRWCISLTTCISTK